jgi:hypothetical protein
MVAKASPPVIPFRRCRGADIVRYLDTVYQVHEVSRDRVELIDLGTMQQALFDPNTMVFCWPA